MAAGNSQPRATRRAAGLTRHAAPEISSVFAALLLLVTGSHVAADDRSATGPLPIGADLRFERLAEDPPLTRLVLSPDGRRIYAGSAAGHVGVWDIESGRLLEALTAGGISEPILGLHVDAGGHVRALAGDELLHWDDVGRVERTGIDTDAVAAGAFAADGKRLVACGAEPPIRVFDAASGGSLRSLDPTLSADELAFSPDGTILAGARLWRLCLWSADSGDEFSKRRLEGTVRGFIFSADGRHIFADVDYEGILILESETGTVLRTLARPGIPDLKDDQRRAIAISPDSSLLAETGPAGALIVWEVFTGRRVLTLSGHEAPIAGVAFHPDGRRLVSIGEDGAALLWDLHHESLLSAEDAGDSLTSTRIEQLWHQLGDDNGDLAYRAFVALLHHRQQTLALIESPPGLDGLAERLIARLDDADSAVRSTAYERLKSLNIAAEPMLRARLEQGTSAELSSRIRRLLGHLRGRRGERERHELARRHRLLRSVHLLKWIGTSEARELLDELAQSDDSAVEKEANSVREWLDRE